MASALAQMPMLGDGAAPIQYFWIALSDAIVAVPWARDGITEARHRATFEERLAGTGQYLAAGFSLVTYAYDIWHCANPNQVDIRDQRHVLRSQELGL